MSREIKFRAWDKEHKKMIYEGFDSTTTFANVYGIHSDEFGNVHGFYFDKKSDYFDLVLMQFTGLRDKNRKEIYEGDVLQFDQKYEFWQQNYYQKYKVEIPKIYYTAEFNGLTGETIMDIEVIGNIYETPNLLNP